MVNASEEILSAFAKLYFFEELVHDSLQFTPTESCEKEVADLLLNLGDVIVAIQLKWRNDKSATDSEAKEIKWLGKKCKDAKSQVKESIGYIRSGTLPAFSNGRNQSISLNSDAKIIPLVIFMNKGIKKYDHVLRKHSEDGMDINCLSFEDFQKMCEALITPIEIVEYLEWRLQFYENNGPVDFMMYEAADGTVTFTKPKNNEALAYQFLAEEYGIQQSQELEMYIQAFRDFLHRLPDHTVVKSEEIADYEMVRFFAHFNRQEIKPFIERLHLAVDKAYNAEYGMIGSLRNVLRKYLVVFTSSKYGNGFPMEYLLEVAPNGDEVLRLLQLVIYWENDDEYRVDFHFCDFTRKERNFLGGKR